MTDRLQNCGSFLFIEWILCINKEKPPVLLLWVVLKQKTHHVDNHLNPRFQTPVEMLHPTEVIVLRSCHCQDAIGKSAPPIIANNHRLYTSL